LLPWRNRCLPVTPSGLFSPSSSFPLSMFSNRCWNYFIVFLYCVVLDCFLLLWANICCSSAVLLIVLHFGL
jgi:hypothetical protein